jgi:hypothetical protein
MTGCNNKIYFTQSVRNQLQKYNQPLNKVQFYIDRKITLTREVQRFDSAGNKFLNRNIIKLKTNTPGVCSIIQDSLLCINFENGKLNFIMFGINNKSKPLDPYRILAKSWSKDYGIIKYEDNQYHMPISESYAGIMINPIILKRLEKRDTKKRTIKGLKIDEIIK